MADIEIECPIHYGTPYGLVPNPTHPARHSFTYAQAQLLLSEFSTEDWEDGPRCLLDVLKEIE